MVRRFLEKMPFVRLSTWPSLRYPRPPRGASASLRRHAASRTEADDAKAIIVPAWLQEVSRHVTPEELSVSRNDFMEALKLYHQHVIYTITIMLAAPIAAGALFSITELPAYLANTLLVFAGVALMCTLPLARTASQILARYYEVYVSCLVYSVQLHVRAGLWKAHPWMERTVRKANDLKAKDSRDFIHKRLESKDDTYYLYSTIVKRIGWACATAGLLVFAIAVGQILVCGYRWWAPPIEATSSLHVIGESFGIPNVFSGRLSEEQERVVPKPLRGAFVIEYLRRITATDLEKELQLKMKVSEETYQGMRYVALKALRPVQLSDGASGQMTVIERYLVTPN